MSKLTTIKRRTIYTGTSIHPGKVNTRMFSKKTKAGKDRRAQLASKYKGARKAGIKLRRGYTVDQKGYDYFNRTASISQSRGR